LGFIHIDWLDVDASSTIINSNKKTTPHSSSPSTTTTTTPLLQQQPQPSAGIVSNHCGWVDIIIVMARYFPAFAARSQTKYLPLIGPISRAMSCLYVDRATQGQGIASLVRDRMQATYNGDMPGARPMLLFPEGTTTNGNYLLPFRTGAFIAGVPLQPIVLQYHHSGRVSPCWESISAAKHIFLMLCEPFHSVTLYQLPVYLPNEGEMADPKMYAANVRQVMRQFAGLKDASATFLDKLRYHSYLRKKHGIVDKKKERLLMEMEQQEESSSKER
jgi:lysophosphatidylcholine acyltransferase / lyso-PAF acetyltransferase